MRRHGFTVVEGMIAMVLLAIILVGVAPIFYFGRRTSAAGAIRRQAAQVGAGELEAALSSGFSQLQITHDPVSYDVEIGDGDQTRTFTVTITVADYPEGPSGSLKEVTSKVEWTFGDRTEDLTFSTLIGEASHGS